MDFFSIIQAVFGCMEIYDASILTDAVKIMRNGERITKCLYNFNIINNLLRKLSYCRLN